LKPDVCRRVVGRLPSPGSKSRDGATVQPPLPFPEVNQEKERGVHGGLSCEIDRTYARFRSLTTGTFNLVVKDRIAIRQSGANSVQANSHKCESDCPRNLTNILCCTKSCQPKHSTGFPDVFHIGHLPGRRKQESSTKSCHSDGQSHQALSFRTGEAREESAF